MCGAATKLLFILSSGLTSWCGSGFSLLGVALVLTSRKGFFSLWVCGHEALKLSPDSLSRALPDVPTKPHPGQELAHHRLPIFPGKTLPSWGQPLLSQNFELLCRDGSRADVTEWRRCHLARVPAHAVMVRADTDGGLIFRLLNEGQVSSGHPTQFLRVMLDLLVSHRGWSSEPSWGWASQTRRARTPRPCPGTDPSWGARPLGRSTSGQLRVKKGPTGPAGSEEGWPEWGDQGAQAPLRESSWYLWLLKPKSEHMSK